MHDIFNPENRVWNFFGKMADVTAMSVLWLIASLPIITIGSATAAFYDFTLKAVRDQEGTVWQSFWRSLRKYLFKGMAVGMAETGGLLFLANDMRLAVLFARSAEGKQWGIILLVLLSGIAMWLISWSMYAFGIMVTFEHSLSKIAGDAMILSVRFAPVTACMIALQVLGGWLFYQLSGFFFFWCGGIIFFSSYLLNYVFIRIAD